MTNDSSTPWFARLRESLDVERVVSYAFVAIVLLGVGGLLLSSPGGTGVVSAQTNNTTNVSDVAPYYNNSTPTVDNESWMDGRRDPTLDNVSSYATRVGSFVIGTGVTAQGGVGSAGALVLGFTVLSVLMGTLVGGRAGMVGGGVIAVVSTSGLVAVGIIPVWIEAVVLLGLGIVVTAIFLRAVR